MDSVTKPKVLYHFTCSHSKKLIGTSNCLLIPQIHHPLLGCKVTWLTTEPEPDRFSTGLGNETGLVPCDRMEHRYVVNDLAGCRAWLTSPERGAAPKSAVQHLESHGDVEHWWISDKPIRARFDRSWSP